METRKLNELNEIELENAFNERLIAYEEQLLNERGTRLTDKDKAKVYGDMVKELASNLKIRGCGTICSKCDYTFYDVVDHSMYCGITGRQIKDRLGCDRDMNLAYLIAPKVRDGVKAKILTRLNK